MPLEQVMHQLEIITSGEGFHDLTKLINNWIKASRIQRGVLNLTALHTSCSLTINENADPLVLKDLSTYMKALVPEEGAKPISGLGERLPYKHSYEGPDDMPAHIKTSLTSSCLSLSIEDQRLLLGTWQAVYLWEHRYSKQSRKICLHAIGEIQKSNKSLEVNANFNSALTSARNASKLNKIVQQRHNPEDWASEDGHETNVDLLIDRIHDLTCQDDRDK